MPGRCGRASSGPLRGPAQPGRLLPADRPPAVPPPRRPARIARVGPPQEGAEQPRHARLHVRDAQPVPRHARLLRRGRRHLGLGVGADDGEEPCLPRRPHRHLPDVRRGLEPGGPHPRPSSSAPTPTPAPCHTGATRTSRSCARPRRCWEYGDASERPARFEAFPRHSVCRRGKDSYCAEAIRRTSANSKRLPSRAAGRSPAAETTVVRRSAASACFAAILASVVRSIAASR